MRVHRVRNLLLLVTGVLTAIVTAYYQAGGIHRPRSARVARDDHAHRQPLDSYSGNLCCPALQWHSVLNVLSVLPDSTVDTGQRPLLL